MKKIWVDCLGICDFVALGLRNFDRFGPEALSYVTGWDFSPKEANLVAERTINLEKILSIQRGFTLEDDLNVGHRVLEAPTAGPAKGKTFAPHLKELVLNYYKEMGWDENGIPTKETLKRLSLE